MKTTLMRALVALFLAADLFFAAPAATVRAQTPATPSPALDGFTPEESATERQLEDRFRAVPRPDSAREHLRQLTKEAHVAGTPEDYQTALYVRDRLREYGIPAELKEYQVLL